MEAFPVVIRCPCCGEEGDASVESVFEARGVTPEDRWPVRKCAACGQGLYITHGRRGRVKARGIPVQDWNLMEAMWDDHLARLPHPPGP